MAMGRHTRFSHLSDEEFDAVNALSVEVRDMLGDRDMIGDRDRDRDRDRDGDRVRVRVRVRIRRGL